MVDVMAGLRKDHRVMSVLLDVLETETEPLRGQGEPNYPLLYEIVNYCVSYPDIYHHPKEDIVYRRLVANGANADQVGDMEAAHQELSGITHRLHDELTAAYKTGEANRPVLLSQLESFINAYRLHIDAEEKVFFPLGEELLTPDDWSEISDEVAQLKDPLYGESVQSEYVGLNDILLDRVELAINAGADQPEAH